MAFILDHLNALIAAAGVILILGMAQIGAQRAALEQTTSYATKTKALSFGEWLEDDILTIGENFGRNRYRFLPPESDAEGNTTKFTFYSDSVQANGDTLRLMTRYRLVLVRTVVRGGETIELFEVQRYLAQAPVLNGQAPLPPETYLTSGSPGPSAWTGDGRSLETLSGFKISLLERNGQTTGDSERGDFIHVEFRLVPEFPIEPEYLRELYWTTTLKVRPFWEPPPEA
jgi:hypothetical protein